MQFSLVEIPGLSSSGAHFVGSVLSAHGSVICIPANAENLVEYQPDGSVRTVGSVSSQLAKWEGGVLFSNGTVVATQYQANGFLTLTPTFVVDSLPGVAGVQFEGAVVTLSGTMVSAGLTGSGFATGQLGASAQFFPIDAGPTTSNYFSGAVLLGDGASVLLVPRGANASWRVNASGASSRAAEVTGHSGGLLLENGDPLLIPTLDGRPFVRLLADGGVVESASTRGAFVSGAWSTNGFGYAIQTDGREGQYAIIDRDGGVTIQLLSQLPVRLPDGGVDLAASHIRSTTHYGLTALADGRLVSCPYQSPHLLVLTPANRRTLPLSVMTSPWLNKL
ncbi:MAG: hypothetical protein JNJ54_10185 [Myxococcaceae bacterium]|nr:hypothetical protein [Myxococcaceae bacterium]